MIRIQIDRNAKRTYSKQIYHAIRQMILNGELAAGEALPPYSQMSAELDVSKNTVLAAYDMLAADGMVRSTVGSGFYIEAGTARRTYPTSPKAVQSAALTDLVLPDGTINFDNGRPALEMFPRTKWNKTVSAAMLDISADALGYDIPQGRPELRSALCEYLRKTQGITCSPDNIIITSGAKQAISLVSEYLLKEDREVWIEDPSPSLLTQMLSSHTDNITPLAVDRYGLDPAAFPLDKVPRLVICSPSRHFPTGAVMPTPRRIALVEFAMRTGAYILEDNFETEFIYDGPPSTSLYELTSDHVISVGTFSKVMYPSIRLGYMIVPPELLGPLCALKRLTDHHSNPVYQLAMATFINDGTLEKHIRRMKREYRSRRDHLIQCLTELFGNKVHISADAGGMNIIAAWDGVRFTKELTDELVRGGVYAVPLASQSMQPSKHENKLILRYCGLTKDELTLGAWRLYSVISQMT